MTMRIVTALFLALATVLFVIAAFTSSTGTQIVLLIGGAGLQLGAFSAAYARRTSTKKA